MNEMTQDVGARSHKIFISHSSDDAKFVQALVELLEFLGLNEKSVICTSVKGYGIPLGENIYDYLRTQFVDYDLFVIFVHSHNFYSSCACLNEMGAAWALKTDYCSILTKGFGYDELKGVVDGKRIAIKVDDDSASARLNELKEIIVETFSLAQPTASVWERWRNKFLTTVNSLQTTNETSHDSKIDEELKRYQLKEYQEQEEAKKKANIILNMTRGDKGLRNVDVVNIGLSDARNARLEIMSRADNLHITPDDLAYPVISANGGSRRIKIRLFIGSPRSIDFCIYWEDNFSNDNRKSVTLDF